MNEEFYINKASIQIKKGYIGGTVCSMKAVIEMNNDKVATIYAHSFLGEYFL